LLTLSFEWLHERINEACDRIFFPSLHDAESRLHEEGTHVAAASTFEQVDVSLVEAPVTALALTSSAVFRVEGGRYVRRQAVRWGDGTATELDARCALALHADRRDRPFRLREIAPCEERFPAGSAFPAVVVPIRAHGELAALAFYGPHDTGDDLNGEELLLLARFASDAARGYDRAEIVALRKRLAELVDPGHAALARPEPSRAPT
jgi:hypothetical protein